eukprot:8273699-Pyramimonas_sp.AAC.1
MAVAPTLWMRPTPAPASFKIWSLRDRDLAAANLLLAIPTRRHVPEVAPVPKFRAAPARDEGGIRNWP